MNYDQGVGFHLFFKRLNKSFSFHLWLQQRLCTKFWWNRNIMNSWNTRNKPEYQKYWKENELAKTSQYLYQVSNVSKVNPFYTFLLIKWIPGISIVFCSLPTTTSIFISFVVLDMSRAEKRSLQSSQKRVRNTIGYHLSPVTITTQTIKGKQAITSHTEKGIKLRLNVIHGVISILYIV